MSTTNNPPRARQIALNDGTEPPDSRTRARDESFDTFLHYYDNASIRDAKRLAADPDPDEVDSFSILRKLGNGTRCNLVECPIAGCHAPFNPNGSPAEHFFRYHQPADLGLTPIQTPKANRTVAGHTDERIEIEDSQATLGDY